MSAQVSQLKLILIELPVDCVVGDWSPWSHCQRSCDLASQSCDIPLKNRTGSVVVEGKNGGKRCPENLSQLKSCDASENCTFFISLSAVLFLLLLLQTIGLVWFVCKVKKSGSQGVKKDLNPLYGVDYEMESKDKNQRGNSDNYDYMG